MRASLRHLPLLLLPLCPVAAAQAAPPPGPPGPGPDRVPSATMLATIPGLSVAQQQQLRQLLIQRRDAREALRQRERAALEKIDADSTERIRGLLGEQAYVRYAKWSLGGPGGQDFPPPPPRDGNGSPLLPPGLDSNGTPPAASGSNQ